MKWFVLYTKPNYELKVAEGINSLGIHAYCPTYTQIKHYTDRKKKVQKPLLPSYVMVQLAEQDRPKVFTIPGVIEGVDSDIILPGRIFLQSKSKIAKQHTELECLAKIQFYQCKLINIKLTESSLSYYWIRLVLIA